MPVFETLNCAFLSCWRSRKLPLSAGICFFIVNLFSSGPYLLMESFYIFVVSPDLLQMMWSSGTWASTPTADCLLLTVQPTSCLISPYITDRSVKICSFSIFFPAIVNLPPTPWTRHHSSTEFRESISLMCVELLKEKAEKVIWEKR